MEQSYLCKRADLDEETFNMDDFDIDDGIHIENEPDFIDLHSSYYRPINNYLSRTIIPPSRPTQITLHIKLLAQNITVPTRGSKYSAGIDVYSPNDKWIPGGQQLIVRLGFCVAWSGPDADKYYLQISPRSGLCAKHQITPMAGVIDYDYRDEVCVILYNYGGTDYKINYGDRIAQFVLKKIEMPIIEVTDELPFPEIDRKGGFGSTGR